MLGRVFLVLLVRIVPFLVRKPFYVLLVGLNLMFVLFCCYTCCVGPSSFFDVGWFVFFVRSMMSSIVCWLFCVLCVVLCCV